jgi:hypothetical protein
VAEIVREPSPHETTVSFRYVQEDGTEVALLRDWWNSLGRPGDGVTVLIKATEVMLGK